MGPRVDGSSACSSLMVGKKDEPLESYLIRKMLPLWESGEVCVFIGREYELSISDQREV